MSYKKTTPPFFSHSITAGDDLNSDSTMNGHKSLGKVATRTCQFKQVQSYHTKISPPRIYCWLWFIAYLWIYAAISREVSGMDLRTFKRHEDINSSNETFRCIENCRCTHHAQTYTLEIENCIERIEKPVSKNDSNTDILVPLVEIKHLHLLNMDLSIKLVREFEKYNFTLTTLHLFNVSLNPLLLYHNSFLKASTASLLSLHLIGVTSSTTLKDLAKSWKPAPFVHLQSLRVRDSDQMTSHYLLSNAPPIEEMSINDGNLIEFQTLSPACVPKLKNISLAHNRIQRLPDYIFSRMKSLLDLDISHNRIEHLQERVFEGLTSLLTFDASHNNIKYIDLQVFSPTLSIETIDLSNNNVIQFFEPYFEANMNLTYLNISNFWIENSFNRSDWSSATYEMGHLIDSLRHVTTLDISYNGIILLPETLSHLTHIQNLYLHGNPWKCRCRDRWFQDWYKTVSIHVDSLRHDLLSCHRENSIQEPFLQRMVNLTTECNETQILSEMDINYYATEGQDILLHCHEQKEPLPTVSWTTPSKLHIDNNDLTPEVPSHHFMYPNGSLLITSFTRTDIGMYLCITSFETLNITHKVRLGINVSYFSKIQIESILVGWAFSFSFLAVIAIGQFVQWVLRRLGLACDSITMSSKQTRQLKSFFETLEAQKNSQLIKLKEQYKMQTCKIKENCNVQMEKLRESYTNQVKNLTDIRDFGTQQFHTLSEQYHEQSSKVTTYSRQRLYKVRENYLFQRNRVRKYGGHKILQIRNSYKFQAQQVARVLEKLPTLNFDSCRGVDASSRAGSVYLQEIDENGQIMTLSITTPKIVRDEDENDQQVEYVALLMHENIQCISQAHSPTKQEQEDYVALKDQEHPEIKYSTPSCNENSENETDLL